MALFFRAAKVRCLAAFATMLAFAAPLHGTSYLSRFWQTDDGLPSNVVSGVARDPQGFVWVATGVGVARFDGLRFELFSLAEGLPDTQVHCLHIDRLGRIWAGTRHGAAYLENGIWRRVEGLPSSSVFSLGEAMDGSIWLGTYTDCWRWNQGKVSRIDLGEIPADTRAFLDDGYGGLWILTRGHLCRWRPDRPGEARSVAGPWNGYDLRDLCRDTMGRRIIVGTGLLLRETAEGWEDLGESLPGGQAGANLSCASSSDGTLWVTTRDRGVLALEKDQWSHFDSTGQVTLDDVRNVLIDHEGLVWLGTNGGGLNLLRRRPFESYASREGLGRTVTSALVIDAQGDVWAGTDGGGILLHRNRRFVPFHPSEKPGAHLIWSLCATRDGSLWAGTYREGLLRIRQDLIESIPLPEAGADLEITALHEMSDGSLLAGVPGLGVFRWKDGAFDPSFRGPEHPTLRIHDLHEDRRGRVWAACGSHGLWRRQEDAWTRVGEESGKDVLNPVALLEDHEGDLWIGTLGQGLIRYRDSALTRWNLQQGLISDTIVQLLEDLDGNLWIGSDKGLQRLSRQELDSSERLSGIRLGRADGLPTPQFTGEHGNLCARAADGTLWFSLASGAIHLDPQQFSKPPLTPLVLIESAVTDQGSLWDRGRPDSPREIVVPPGSGPLRIRFTSPEFIAPERTRFRCRMSGLEQAWQEIEGVRTVSYSSLPPGKYRFDLRIASHDGSWSRQSDTITVVMQPYFWQRLDFRIAVTIASAGLLGFIVYKWSRYRLRRKVEALRQERRVELERARIARDLHDDLGASLTEINFLGTLAGNAMAEGPSRDKVQGMVDRARQMAKSLDEIVWTVNPRNDSLSSTVHYLCSRVRESLAAAGIRCRLEVDEEIPECTLDSQLRHHLLMTVNEAINNVMKHSGAHEVTFRIQARQQRLRLRIADNGKGFQPMQESVRNGLENMRRRMESAGGSFLLTPSPSGTLVDLELPLTQPK